MKPRRVPAHDSWSMGLLGIAAALGAFAFIYFISSLAAGPIITNTAPSWYNQEGHVQALGQAAPEPASALKHAALQDAAPQVQDEGVEAVLAISAANDIHRVRSLFAAVAHHQPSAKRYLCLFGTRSDLNSSRDTFETITLEDLDIHNVHRPLFWYSVVEGSTFIKPECIRHMFAKKGVQRLVYFDNDILLFKDVDDIFARLRAFSFVLAPHMTEPLPNDGRHPQDIHVLASGTYNLGFLGIARTATALKMLAWWNDKLYAQAFNAVHRGMMTDQRWADYIPSMFGNAYIERRAGYDTAWWNLHYNGRLIRFNSKDDVTINGLPLVFYHFSGFDYQKPSVLSKHQTRFSFDDLPNIVPMYQYYSEQLRLHDTRTPDEQQAPFMHFDNGLVIPDFVRPWYATLSPQQLDSLGNPFATSLSTNNGTAVLLDFLLENYCQSVYQYMPQVLAMSYNLRPDLQRAFPHICGAQNHQLLAWFAQAGAQQVHTMDRQLRDWILARQRMVGRVNVPEPLGAVVIGFLTGEFGIGESARLTARALQEAQVTTKILPLVAPMHSNRDMSLSGFARAAEPLGFNIFQVNADSVAGVMRTPGVMEMLKLESQWKSDPSTNMGEVAPNGKRPINVVVWFWELSAFPIHKFQGCTEGIDEIWVATRFIEGAVAAVSPVPVYQIDFPVPELTTSAGPPSFDLRANLGLHGRFIFFFNFDYLSCLRRKNPDGVLAAFLEAFNSSSVTANASGSGPALVIKSINSKYSPESRQHWAQMKANVPPGAPVHFIDQLLPHTDMDAMLGTIDCYVSLHRAEGLGLGMLQAMQLRKPVIATAYSGNMDFMAPESSYLVDYSLVPVGTPWGPYDADAVWAEPHMPHAVRLMRHVFEHPSEAAMKGLLASEYVSRRYSLHRAGMLIKQRMKYLRKLATGQ